MQSELLSRTAMLCIDDEMISATYNGYEFCNKVAGFICTDINHIHHTKQLYFGIMHYDNRDSMEDKHAPIEGFISLPFNIIS